MYPQARTQREALQKLKSQIIPSTENSVTRRYNSALLFHMLIECLGKHEKRTSTGSELGKMGFKSLIAHELPGVGYGENY